MDTNDRIAELTKDIPNGANVCLVKTPRGTYVLIWDGERGWKMINLSEEDGELLATVYPLDVNTLGSLPFSVMQVEIRKRYLDSILADLA